MTAKEALEFTLIELNKREAPSLLLADFNYFLNKTIGQKINKYYNLYDTNQQKSDDLRVLKSTTILTPTVSDDYSSDSLLQNVYEAVLPNDYLHILNCTVEYSVTSKYLCNSTGSAIHFGAKRLTSDMSPQIITNFYFKPKYNNPYYYIHTATSNEEDVDDDTFVDRIAGNRYGNSSQVVIEIRAGSIPTQLQLSKIYIDYLRTPKFIKLTEEEVEGIEDSSQILEFPDYVCQEIVNDLVGLLLENTSDPRLQTNIPLNQSIGQQPSK